MREENRQFLEDNYGYWITLRDADYMRGLNSHQLEGMVRVMREEFIPGYICDTWCPSCVAEMMRNLYTRYDQWKAAQIVEEVKETVPEGTIENVAATFPVNQPVKNNQKKKHRR